MGFIAHFREENYGPLLPGMSGSLLLKPPGYRYTKTVPTSGGACFFAILTPYFEVRGHICRTEAPRNCKNSAAVTHFGASRLQF